MKLKLAEPLERVAAKISLREKHQTGRRCAGTRQEKGKTGLSSPCALAAIRAPRTLKSCPQLAHSLTHRKPREIPRTY
jgi:hypothetical protein